jgi:hypothetical protein
VSRNRIYTFFSGKKWLAMVLTVLALAVGVATLVGSVVITQKHEQPPIRIWWETDISYYGIGVPQYYFFGAGKSRRTLEDVRSTSWRETRSRGAKNVLTVYQA